MGKTLLLVGHPRSGKTTIIREVCTTLGDRAGGFYTEEIFGPGGRKGFHLVTLDGKRAVLAHKDLRGPKSRLVGRYGVDLNVLENTGVRALDEARNAGKIVIIDEIGKMELLSQRFQEAVLRAILGPTPVLGTILYKPHPHADIVKSLAPVTLWEVNPLTRDALPDQILAWLSAQ
ncbi:MAG: AAA family ATPase [Anaerolineae bacterium]|nr:AAA family ATPase [Anaerolineae bacterium]